MINDPRNDPMRYEERKASQMGRLFERPLGFLKFLGTIVLAIVALLVVVFVIGMLLSGRISHV